jgi:hypothetical protein
MSRALVGCLNLFAADLLAGAEFLVCCGLRSPPTRWRTSIRRWEALDQIRCRTAVAAIAALLCAVPFVRPAR